MSPWPWAGPDWAALARVLAFAAVAVLPPLWGAFREVRRAGDQSLYDVYIHLTSVEKREDAYYLRGVEGRRYRLPRTFVGETGAEAVAALRPGEPLTLLVEPLGRDGVAEIYGIRGRDRVYLDGDAARARRGATDWLPQIVAGLLLAGSASFLLLPRAPGEPGGHLSPPAEAQLWAALILLSARLWAREELGVFPAAFLGALLLATGALTWWADSIRKA